MSRRGRPRGPDRHGTPNQYVNRHCHCEPCRQAWADYLRQWRATRKKLGTAA